MVLLCRCLLFKTLLIYDYIYSVGRLYVVTNASVGADGVDFDV